MCERKRKRETEREREREREREIERAEESMRIGKERKRAKGTEILISFGL